MFTEKWNITEAYSRFLIPLSTAYKNNEGDFAEKFLRLIGAVEAEGVHVVGLSSETGDSRFFLIKPEEHIKSKKLLRGHTEAGFLDFPTNSKKAFSSIPEYICMYCLSNEDNIPTRALPVDFIVTKLDDKQLSILMEPNYVVLPQTTFRDSKHLTGDSWRPLFEDIDGEFIARFSSGRTICKTERAQNAKKLVEAIFSHYAEDVILRPGEMLALNNLKCLHGRGPILNPNESNRLMIRFYAYRQRSDVVYKKQGIALP